MRRLPRTLVGLTALTLTCLLACAQQFAFAVSGSIPGAQPETGVGQRAVGPGYPQLSSWRGPELAAGAMVGAQLVGDAVVLGPAPKTRKYAGRRWQWGSWTSPWLTTEADFERLVVSWQASTPGGTWIDLRVRAMGADGQVGSWDDLADWTGADKPVVRRTFGAQTDDVSRVSVDTVIANPGQLLSAWQVSVRLMRRTTAKNSPLLRAVHGVAGPAPSVPTVVSTPTTGLGVTLEVPTMSQMLHVGHYPEWDGGGQAWCSAASTAMVMSFLGKLPAAAATWPGPTHPDGAVDYVARMVYDHTYEGTGNWAFNTAFAGQYVSDAYVTRMSSLNEAEASIAAGIPLVASISYGRDELPGSPVPSSAGHLLVIVGFTATGDVVVNDPAGATNADVRRIYPRAAFERVWLAGSGGVVYVIR